MPSTLGYLKVRGLAGPIRLLLEYTGEPYVEKRYSFDNVAEWFEKDKPQLREQGMAFPNLPYYVDGDMKLSQSNVILRYIADKHHMSGKGSKQQYEVMVLEQQVTDMRQAFTQLCFNPQFENLKDEYVKTKLPEILRNFSQYLDKKRWLIGDDLTYPDFHLYEMLFCNLKLEPTCLDTFHNLKTYMDNFQALPQIREYMASDRYISWPIHGPIAKFGFH